MNYRKIEIWKNTGFITNNLSSEKQLELGKNLSFGKDILNCFNVLENYDEDFYKDVESVLYPTIVYYTLNNNKLLEENPIVHNFIKFCEDNINVKYNYWTIQTPLQIKIKPFKSKALSLNFGGYLGFNYYNSASSSNSNITANQNEDKQLLDKGIIAGIDYIWLKKGNFTFGNSLSYYCGLSDLNPMQPFLVAFGIPHIVTKSQGITIDHPHTVHEWDHPDFNSRLKYVAVSRRTKLEYINIM